VKETTPYNRTGQPGIPKIQWGETEISGPRHEYREGLLMGLIRRQIPPGSRILDAGCGGGSLLMRMASSGYRVDGIEASDPFVRSVREKIGRSRLGETATVQPGSVTAIPFGDGLFDAVTSCEVLEHVLDDGQAVGEFHRVLRPGGICVVSVPAHPELWDFTDDWAGHVRRYERGQLRALFESRGFRVLSIASWGFPLVRWYNSCLYVPYARRRVLAGGGSNGIGSPVGGPYRFLSAMMGVAFHVDSLFRWLPWGIGWLMVSRRH
jgi:SAM-dependent methyltransferase